MIYQTVYKSPVGDIKIIEENDCIIEVLLVKNEEEKIKNTTDTPLLLTAKQQLNEYFSGTRKYFDLPLCPKGTKFQKKTWKALLTIPYGTTISYKDLAKVIGNEKASRAVGGANNKNPIMIMIPCHRVIGSTGKLVGYAGGIKMKEYLLNLEQQDV